jgi:hypothetical protein
MNAARHAWIAGVTGLAAGLAFAVRWALLGDVDGRGFALALLGAALLGVYAWLDDEEAPLVPTGHRLGRVAWGLGLLAVVAVGALGAYVGVREVDDAWDLSARGAFSLRESSRALLRYLPGPVEVQGVFVTGSERARAFGRIARALEAVDGPIEVSVVDPRRDPLRAHALGVQDDAGQIVIQAGGHVERLTDRLDEAAVVSAILRAAGGEEHVICYATGQGEPGLDDDDDPGSISALVVALEGRAFSFRPVSPLAGPIEPDCDALAVVRPREDWSPEALSRLDAWLRGGGAALILLEPGSAPRLAAHLGAYGLDLPDAVVLDPDPQRRMASVGDPSVLVLPRAAWIGHAVSDGLAGAVVLPLARPVRPVDGAPGMSWRALAFSSASSWAETSRAPGPQGFVADPGEARGELPLVAAGEVVAPERLPGAPPEGVTASPGGRLFVVGDASFADNTFLDLGSNQELFGHALAWLLGEDTAIAEVPLHEGAIELTTAELSLTAVLAWLGAPGLAAALALQRWLALRRA